MLAVLQENSCSERSANMLPETYAPGDQLLHVLHESCSTCFNQAAANVLCSAPCAAEKQLLRVLSQRSEKAAKYL